MDRGGGQREERMLLMSGEIWCVSAASCSGDLEADYIGWPLGVRPAVERWLAAEVRPLSPNRPSECQGEGNHPCQAQSVWPGLRSVCLTHELLQVSSGLYDQKGDLVRKQR